MDDVLRDVAIVEWLTKVLEGVHYPTYLFFVCGEKP
jgi:hypothetical protein